MGSGYHRYDQPSRGQALPGRLNSVTPPSRLPRITTAGMRRLEDVSIGEVLKNPGKERENGQERDSVCYSEASGKRDCLCAEALQHAVITNKKFIPEKTKKNLELIIGKYI